ncbi:putative Glycolipid transfer protein (Gltp) [Trichostrongylus colubriformis]|uniref:Glycolipid transfer protein (Gltp) n=1 Tax=Trichostrongylus colubriformis TaxID=6319 RepID=A0AAN8IN35_TRICO
MVEKDKNDSTDDDQKFRIDVVIKNLEASSEYLKEDIDLAHFIGAYEELNKFIGLLGKIFKFVQADVREKTNMLLDLREKNPESYRSVKSMITFENEQRYYPGSKALLGLHRALEFIASFIAALAESTNEDSVASICRKSYEETLSRFHNWMLRKAVSMASYTLPSRGQLITSIQGDLPEEDHLRTVLTTVVAKTQVVYSRVDSVYSEYNLHSLL